MVCSAAILHSTNQHHFHEPVQLNALDEIRMAVPGIADDVAYLCTSGPQARVMCAIGTQFKDIVKKLSVPSMNPAALRLKGHEDFPSCKASEDAHRHTGNNMDYLSTVLANTYLYGWPQLGLQDSAEFQRIV